METGVEICWLKPDPTYLENSWRRATLDVNLEFVYQGAKWWLYQVIIYFPPASKCWLMLAADQGCTWDGVNVRESGRIRCGNKQSS